VKDYWSTRDWDREFRFQRLAKSKYILPLVDLVASLRTSDELFVLQELKRRKHVRTVLDLAAGAGQDVLGRNFTAIGVDLPGAPIQRAFEKGYLDYKTYEADISFTLEYVVDAIVCINLNAHVDFSLLMKLIKNGEKFMREDGVIIMVNEYDNNGLSYARMRKKNYQSWKIMVERMDHNHLEYEQAFIDKMAEEGFEELSRKVLSGHVLPHLHYRRFRGDYAESRKSKLVSMVADVPLSLVNLLTRRTAGRDKAFLVGHVFKRTST